MSNVAVWFYSLTILISLDCCQILHLIWKLTKNEDDLQRLEFVFNKHVNFSIWKNSIMKTKTTMIALESMWCKVVRDGDIIEQVMEFGYLYLLTSSGQLERK